MSNEPGLRLVHSDERADVDVLLGRIARGDAQAFDALYDEVSPAVYGLARRVVRDPVHAETSPRRSSWTCGAWPHGSTRPEARARPGSSRSPTAEPSTPCGAARPTSD